jgi:hypothetical protein
MNQIKKKGMFEMGLSGSSVSKKEIAPRRL